MKKISFVKGVSVLLLCLTAMSESVIGAEKMQGIVLEDSISELPAGERKSFQFEVKKALAEEEAVLLFEAWLKGKEPAGFSGAIKVYLDGVELTRGRDIPATISAVGSADIPTYTSHGGWLLAYGKDPEELRTLADDNVYRIIEGSHDITSFALVLPELSKGRHTLEFESLTAETGVPVFLRNISWNEVE
jgi:hypothetical protein